jgi:tartrate-resistant acid phosphatase type 5
MVNRRFIAVLVVLLPAYVFAQEVNVLAVGDWGSNDKSQRVVAADMATYLKSSQHKIDAMFLAGDNFYVPLEQGIADAKWRTMFEDLYDRKTFDFPFYVALGNHDYLADRFLTEFAYAQANPKSRWKMPARWYRVDLPDARNPLVTALVLDSNAPIIGEPAWNNELKWLTTELAKPRTAKWLIAVAHHPFFSNGDHGDMGPLQKAWGPLFAQAKLDFFICGHDHDMQHLEIPPYKNSFLLVGGGGAGTRPMRNDKRGPFSKQTHGFGHVTFTQSQATARLIGPGGETIHAFTRDAEGSLAIIKQGDSDPATPRKVADVSRGGLPASRPAAAD